MPPPLIHMSAADVSRILEVQAARLSSGEHAVHHPKTVPWLAATQETAAWLNARPTIRQAINRTKNGVARVQRRIDRLEAEQKRRKKKQQEAERRASAADPASETGAAAGALAVAAASSVAVIARRLEEVRTTKLRIDQAVTQMEDAAAMHQDAFPPSSDFPAEYPMEIWTIHGAQDDICLSLDGILFEPGHGAFPEEDSHPNCVCTRELVMVKF